MLVSIEDTGTGVDSATAEQVFAPFYTTKPGGMGAWGPSSCKTIIEAHGGQFAKLNLPYGAVFQFQLSAASPEVL